MSWDLCKRSEKRADELDKPYSRYIRDLIKEDLKRAQTERLSQQKQANSDMENHDILNRLASLLTNPKAAELLSLIVDGKKGGRK
ncbi:hypothetical protein [Nitrosovibrio sp. Nv6]|uniref:hypothetical protein n=1 Tax=Nitrosovibrio sp. Nv6 TaxID=1855340 RepID=UPI00115FD172|nr:hypothetical protein [Nitrosovibrio sp. Nv6]